MSGLRKRQNVFQPAGDWADPVLWYARGVKAMKARKVAQPTSWAFYGAIHGMFRALWDFYQQTDPADPAPSPADTATYLDQCQHQSWFFLPWHRGYLLALEAIIRDEIRLLGGPHETWALPYWNYFAPGQNVLPPEFRTANWPDGLGDNPLFVEQRWGELSGSAPHDLSADTNLNALGLPEFFGPGGGGTAGFGGPITGFNWNSGTNGGLESDPHNAVHSIIGGQHPTATFQDGTPLPGLMSMPSTAALDPIFYLHHCNIDRLWESWNQFPAGKPQVAPIDWLNPDLELWLEGPESVGQRAFAMPKPDGSQWTYTPAEMQDIAALGYEYADLSPGAPVTIESPVARMVNLGIARSAQEATLALAAAAERRGGTMTSESDIELVGASRSAIPVVGDAPVAAAVRTDSAARRRLGASLRPAAASGLASPDRVFLNLENITGASDTAMLRVYVGLAKGEDPAAHPENLAGTASLFGVSQASDPAGPHAGNGISYTMEITAIIDRLHLTSGIDFDELPVLVVPRTTVAAASKVKIGRISIYRQTG